MSEDAIPETIQVGKIILFKDDDMTGRLREDHIASCAHLCYCLWANDKALCLFRYRSSLGAEERVYLGLVKRTPLEHDKLRWLEGVEVLCPVSDNPPPEEKIATLVRRLGNMNFYENYRGILKP